MTERTTVRGAKAPLFHSRATSSTIEPTSSSSEAVSHQIADRIFLPILSVTNLRVPSGHFDGIYFYRGMIELRGKRTIWGLDNGFRKREARVRRLSRVAPGGMWWTHSLLRTSGAPASDMVSRRPFANKRRIGRGTRQFHLSRPFAKRSRNKTVHRVCFKHFA